MVKERGMRRECGHFKPELYSYRYTAKDSKAIKWAELRATHAIYMGKPSAVTNFIDRCRGLAKNFDPTTINVVSISDEKFHIQGTICPFELGNTSRQLCEVVMAIDREYFLAATDGKTTPEIIKTRAAGKQICESLIPPKHRGKWNILNLPQFNGYLKKYAIERKSVSDQREASDI